MARPIFIIGTGRTGSCWMGRILNSHPAVRCTIEVDPIFQLSTMLALDERLVPRKWTWFMAEYQAQIDQTEEMVYADKSHPNIWHVERLLLRFRDAQFVAMARSPYATVASMLKHRGVRTWSSRWREYPIPNRFLGISKADVNRYDGLTDTEKCAMRWMSHMERLKRLTAADLPVHVVFYEVLVELTRTVLDRLAGKLGLGGPFPMPEVKSSATEKWREQLSVEQQETIERVTGIRPGEGPWEYLDLENDPNRQCTG